MAPTHVPTHISHTVQNLTLHVWKFGFHTLHKFFKAFTNSRWHGCNMHSTLVQTDILQGKNDQNLCKLSCGNTRHMSICTDYDLVRVNVDTCYSCINVRPSPVEIDPWEQYQDAQYQISSEMCPYCHGTHRPKNVHLTRLDIDTWRPFHVFI